MTLIFKECSCSLNSLFPPPPSPFYHIHFLLPHLSGLAFHFFFIFFSLPLLLSFLSPSLPPSFPSSLSPSLSHGTTPCECVCEGIPLNLFQSLDWRLIMFFQETNLGSSHLVITEIITLHIRQGNSMYICCFFIVLFFDRNSKVDMYS